jgi:hypothetical protein
LSATVEPVAVGKLNAGAASPGFGVEPAAANDKVKIIPSEKKCRFIVYLSSYSHSSKLHAPLPGYSRSAFLFKHSGGNHHPGVDYTKIC